MPKYLAYDWQLAHEARPSHAPVELREDHWRYLQPDNPFLIELKQRYARCDPRVVTPIIWTDDWVSSEDLKYFRGDNAYVWQIRDANLSPINYVVSTYYLKDVDYLGLFDRMEEDSDFGNYSFIIDGKLISRDFLDSIAELYFLDRHLQIASRTNLKILDIGAGYGRLAHRAIESLPNLMSYICADGIPVSSFLCEFYLRHRNVQDKAKVVYLDQFQTSDIIDGIDIAVNIHSFSECRYEAIDWWVSEIARRSIRYLFVAPNNPKKAGVDFCTIDGKEFSDIFERHRYRLLVKEPKFLQPEIQEYGLCPSYYFLFKRQED